MIGCVDFCGERLTEKTPNNSHELDSLSFDKFILNEFSWGAVKGIKSGGVVGKRDILVV